MRFQVIEPFDRDSIFKIKSKKQNFMVVGWETDGIELDNPIDFTKERRDSSCLPLNIRGLRTLTEEPSLGASEVA